MKEDPTPIKITKEEEFPVSTALAEGEGMLLKEVPLRGRQDFRGATGTLTSQVTSANQVMRVLTSIATIML